MKRGTHSSWRMGSAIEKWDFIASGTLRVAFYRALHAVSLPANINEFLGYAKENEAGGRFGGRVTVAWNGLLVKAYDWSGIRMGDGLAMDAWFFGLENGPQTVILRKGFWKGNFSRRTADPLGLVFANGLVQSQLPRR